MLRLSDHSHFRRGRNIRAVFTGEVVSYPGEDTLERIVMEVDGTLEQMMHRPVSLRDYGMMGGRDVVLVVIRNKMEMPGLMSKPMLMSDCCADEKEEQQPEKQKEGNSILLLL